MKKYFIRGLLFASPFLIYIMLIVIVDPYNFINISHVISDSNKITVLNRSDESSPRGNLLWKALEVKRKPIKKIIIGDSQGKGIKPEIIEKACGEKIYNFCVPGASFETMFNVFWFLAENQQLETVYFQVAFMNYNAQRSYNLYHYAQDYLSRPYLYFLTKEIFSDTFTNIFYQFTKNPRLVERSYEFLSDDEINKLAVSRLELFFNNYEYPKDYFNELNKIKQYCDANNIELKFLILPSYKAVDEYLVKKNLSEMAIRFKSDIKFNGDTYDLDVYGEVKNTRENFFDYYHLRQPILDSLTMKIWGKK
jgi:hypothetical protein